MERPAPIATRNSEFFWEGAAHGVLLAQRCSGCGRFRHPPRPLCPHCHGLAWEATPLCGRGRVHAWVVPVHPPLPMFPDPLIVALVDLEEGIRMLSNLCEVAAREVATGMAVEVCFAPTARGRAVPQFRPRSRA